jgi:hypothetical protein
MSLSVVELRVTRVPHTAMQKKLLAVLVLLAAGRAAGAQLMPLSGLQPGDTIRVWAVAPRLDGQTGLFDARLRDTLRFTSQSLPIDVSYAALRRVDVRRGVRRSAARVFGATLIGAGVGAFVGSFVGRKLDCGDCHDDDFAGLGGLILGGATGIVAGGLTGGMLASRHRTPRWDAVDLRR